MAVIFTVAWKKVEYLCPFLIGGPKKVFKIPKSFKITESRFGFKTSLAKDE